MDEIMRIQIQAVLNTLNEIPVTGRQPIDKMLGCMMTLERMLNKTEEKDDGEQR